MFRLLQKRRLPLSYVLVSVSLLRQVQHRLPSEVTPTNSSPVYSSFDKHEYGSANANLRGSDRPPRHHSLSRRECLRSGPDCVRRTLGLDWGIRARAPKAFGGGLRGEQFTQGGYRWCAWSMTCSTRTGRPGQPDDFGTGQDVATIFGGSVIAPEVAGRWDDGGSGPGVGGGVLPKRWVDGNWLPELLYREPSTLLLFGTGGLRLIATRRRRKKPQA